MAHGTSFNSYRTTLRRTTRTPGSSAETRGSEPPDNVARMTTRTFVMAKPDAVERGLIGEIVARIERKGLRVVAAEMRVVDPDLAAKHYAEHDGKPFYRELITFITRSPVFAMVVEGPADNTFSLVRMVVGATKVDDALPG